MLEKELVRQRLRDAWSFSLARLFSFLLYFCARFLFLMNRKESGVKLILKSIRYSYLPLSLQFFYKNLTGFDYTKLLSKVANSADAENRAIILSLPIIEKGCISKKGVLLITFSHTFSYFLKHERWEELNDAFLFVLEPSWAGYADPDILAFCQRASHCVIQAAEVKDRSLINTAFPNVPCMDTGASNWIDDEFFNPLIHGDSSEKKYDAIYVANTNPIKRVVSLIGIVERLSRVRNDFVIAVVCARWGGGSVDSLRQLVKRKGLEQNLVVFDGMTQDKLLTLVLSAKCSLLLSLKEGANRVLFESMFLNVPVICISENIGVNKAYINCMTGLLTNDCSVDQAVDFMADNYQRFEPREWALDTISPTVTTATLSAAINNSFRDQVNSSLYIKINCPEVNYKNLKLREFIKVSDMLSGTEKETLIDWVSKVGAKIESDLEVVGG